MDASFPLVLHTDPEAVLAWRHGSPVTVAQFVADVRRLAAALPAATHVLNACADRYHFAVGLAAALLAGKTSLLPPSHTPETIRQMVAFAPDVFCLCDGPTAIALPLLAYDAEAAAPAAAALAAFAGIPTVPGARTLALVFTSGSTGAPVPHRKLWGAVVLDVQAEAAALLLPPAPPVQVLGTVPPQHMYGLESSVLLPLHSGGALCAAHPFYPADICAELARLPRPRLLVTTPVHLRALLDAQVTVPPLDLVLSATAPLSEELAAQAEARLGVPVQEIYGSTETGQIATRHSTRTRYWTLLDGVKLVQQGERCWASGGHVDPPMPLGDLLELAPDGRFLLHGRLGDLVNIAGKRNSLGHLNHQLLAIEGVVDGMFVMPDGDDADGVTRLAAFVVAPGLTEAALRSALRQRIDPIFMPRPLVLLPELPRNSTGKVTRATLDTLLRSHVAAAASRREAP
jgi:acyl-coenzyme A synthetase/AMP-(fatty) acid ligase